MRPWALPLGVFCVALAARAIYLVQSSAAPSFYVPLIDAASYDELARALVAGELPGRLFYQGPFYPLFLAGVYELLGESVGAAKIVQAVLGATTCALTATLGRRLFGAGVGLAAGIVCALNGPLIFFEGELLATGWAAFWTVGLLSWLLYTDDSPAPLRAAVLGIAGALAISTRGTFLPFFVFACGWLLLRARTRLRSRGARLATVGGLGLGFVLVCAPLVWMNGQANDRYALLPHSGGLNLYIGNNGARAETVALRPADFHRVGDLPTHHGFETPGERSAFYTGRVARYAATDPLGFAGGQLAKTIEFASPRELPRNVDIYVFRPGSSLLSALVWKLGAWGFPSGVLFPLALLGLGLQARRLPAPVVAFPVLYAASIILIFVSARYRVALTPITAILACAAVADLVRMAGSGHALRALLLAAGVVGFSLLSALPGPFTQEQTDYATELHYSLGTQLASRSEQLRAAGETERAAEDESEALRHLQMALERDPGYAAAYANLGVLAFRNGAHEEANGYFQRALRFDRSNAVAHQGRQRSLLALGRSLEAARHRQEAKRIHEAVRQEALTR